MRCLTTDELFVLTREGVPYFGVRGSLLAGKTEEAIVKLQVRVSNCDRR